MLNCIPLFLAFRTKDMRSNNYMLSKQPFNKVSVFQGMRSSCLIIRIVKQFNYIDHKINMRFMLLITQLYA